MILVGQNLGLGEISTAADTIEAAAAGANITRVLSRWDGLYGKVFQRDSRDDAAPHNVRPEYVEMLRTQLMTAKACKQTTVLGMDSDQLAGQQGGRDLWTPDGERERSKLIHLGGFYAREFTGLVDYIEPIVEAKGPNVTTEKLWAYQEQFAAWALTKNPALRLLLGPQSYFPGNIMQAFNPAWSTGLLANRITLTVNFADDLVCNEARFEDRLAMVLGARDRWGVPVLVNQIWSDPGHDPDGLFLAARILRLAGEGIGSIVWTACTRFNDPDDSPGLRHLADPNDPRSEHIKRHEIWANVTRAWQEVNA